METVKTYVSKNLICFQISALQPIQLHGRVSEKSIFLYKYLFAILARPTAINFAVIGPSEKKV